MRNNMVSICDDGPDGKAGSKFIVDTAQNKPRLTPSARAVSGLRRDSPAPRQKETRHIPGHDASLPLSPRNVQTQRQLPSFQVLGVRVNAVQMSDAVERLCSWIDNPQPITRYVSVMAMHVLAESRKNDHFRLILNAADLVVPDGMPFVWLGRIKGFPLRHRVCGAELMDSFCRESATAYRHFFFGGTPGVAEELAKALHEKYGIVIAGTYTPPFRALTDEEEEELASLVDQTSPDVIWVGLSSPKQENWMYEHRHKLRVPVMLGVGAAFDMNSGKMRRAPEWMRENGLEWIFRLASEPRRLWKRYLITIPQAVWFVCMELLQFSKLRTAPR